MSTIYGAAPRLIAVLLLSFSSCQEGEKAKDLPVPVAEAEPPKPAVPLSKEDMAYRAKAIKGPATYRVKFETSKGNILIDVYREWSPKGADHFRELVEAGFYNECRFFRVIDGFMAQVGISGDPKASAEWSEKNIQDDKVMVSNRRGFVTFAKSGRPNSRSTQIFINYKNNANLDPDGFSPFGVVVEGQKVAESLYPDYGEGPGAPDQGSIQAKGNKYLNANFPKLDYIKKATIVPVSAPQEKSGEKKKDDNKKQAAPDTSTKDKK